MKLKTESSRHLRNLRGSKNSERTENLCKMYYHPQLTV